MASRQGARKRNDHERRGLNTSAVEGERKDLVGRKLKLVLNRHVGDDRELRRGIYSSMMASDPARSWHNFTKSSSRTVSPKVLCYSDKPSVRGVTKI